MRAIERMMEVRKEFKEETAEERESHRQSRNVQKKHLKETGGTCIFGNISDNEIEEELLILDMMDDWAEIVWSHKMDNEDVKFLEQELPNWNWYSLLELD